MEHHEVVVIGAGQAGLSISWHLTARGIDHLVLERDTIAHEWRDTRWDNFTLVTPNWQCVLPGYRYNGPQPHGFMKRDEVYAWVRGYADTFDPPVREGVAVTAMSVAAGGGFDIETTGGPVHSDQVVVAVGGYHIPTVPRFAERLPGSIRQVHSAEYRSASDLPEGAVLVVGTGQSGAQIAEDLHLAGRDVHLAVGSAPRVARFYRGRDCVAWLQDMGHYDIPIEDQPGGLGKRENTNHYVTGRDGGRDIDLRRFALEGMRLYGRMTDIAGGTAHFEPSLESSLDAADAVAESIKDSIDAYIDRAGIDAPTEPRYRPVWRPEHEVTEIDLTTGGITSVVWSVGFRTDYRWLRVGVFDGEGHPCHNRGVTSVEGLYFLGLPWLHTWGSGRFAAVARDAEYLADRITVTARATAAA
ncbi:MSMEG_0569 family flavin-dependent oxidoreductase [Nocardia nova]|uniref:MSMEG_0569 family flavin-dependent oxidoreductase n=1 Tax=Nocardia nova TaxID=37330 RepID=A0A2S6AL60_9NOCA|nr:MSMEG_0569 family flavin-dependent oxidoreductase [Nocardia nova]PPJ31693.1 MSMEG_0569 family flavin-dependent oxidoreductase [Nocardia nova]PPJ35933.1 MSMEG_0569 family flavin-dependent oxidoreductase [Nocardia nova]